MKKATDFYDILNSIEFNNPIDENNNFFQDFSNLRQGFNEKRIFKMLSINPKTTECHNLSSPQRIFLSGHRGTGKTTELLKLQNQIKKTNCFLPVFCDVSHEELDLNNIDFVDIVIFMLEKLITILNEKRINVDTETVKSFYNWYRKRIKEINTKTDSSATISTGGQASISIPGLLSIITKTKAKFSASHETKETIRTVFKNNFSDFSLKFNTFIGKIKEELVKEHIAKDLLFIIDGFEKIGTLEDRKKILLDNSNKFVEIKSHMIISLPIELFNEVAQLSEFAHPITFPLVTLNKDGIDAFKEFIYKRIHKDLFENESVVEKVITYGAGSPRETLKILQEAYISAEGEIIDDTSVTAACQKISEEIVTYLEEEEIELLKSFNENKQLPYSDVKANLLIKKVLLEYSTSQVEINPVILENELFKSYIK